MWGRIWVSLCVLPLLLDWNSHGATVREEKSISAESHCPPVGLMCPVCTSDFSEHFMDTVCLHKSVAKATVSNVEAKENKICGRLNVEGDLFKGTKLSVDAYFGISAFCKCDILKDMNEILIIGPSSSSNLMESPPIMVLDDNYVILDYTALLEDNIMTRINCDGKRLEKVGGLPSEIDHVQNNRNDEQSDGPYSDKELPLNDHTPYDKESELIAPVLPGPLATTAPVEFALYPVPRYQETTYRGRPGVMVAATDLDNPLYENELIAEPLPSLKYSHAIPNIPLGPSSCQIIEECPKCSVEIEGYIQDNICSFDYIFTADLQREMAVYPGYGSCNVMEIASFLVGDHQLVEGSLAFARNERCGCPFSKQLVGPFIILASGAHFHESHGKLSELVLSERVHVVRYAFKNVLAVHLALDRCGRGYSLPAVYFETLPSSRVGYPQAGYIPQLEPYYAPRPGPLYPRGPAPAVHQPIVHYPVVHQPYSRPYGTPVARTGMCPLNSSPTCPKCFLDFYQPGAEGTFCAARSAFVMKHSLHYIYSDSLEGTGVYAGASSSYSNTGRVCRKNTLTFLLNAKGYDQDSYSTGEIKTTMDTICSCQTLGQSGTMVLVSLFHPLPNYGEEIHLGSDYALIGHPPGPIQLPSCEPAGPIYSASSPVYSASGPGYPASAPLYLPPRPVYPTPAHGYPAHQPTYSVPSPVYSASRPAYSVPSPGYPASSPGYPVPRPAYSRLSYPADEPSHPADEPSHPADEPSHPDTKPSHPNSEHSHPDPEPSHPDPEPEYPDNVPNIGCPDHLDDSCPVCLPAVTPDLQDLFCAVPYVAVAQAVNYEILHGCRTGLLNLKKPLARDFGAQVRAEIPKSQLQYAMKRRCDCPALALGTGYVLYISSERRSEVERQLTDKQVIVTLDYGHTDFPTCAGTTVKQPVLANYQPNDETFPASYSPFSPPQPNTYGSTPSRNYTKLPNSPTPYNPESNSAPLIKHPSPTYSSHRSMALASSPKSQKRVSTPLRSQIRREHVKTYKVPTKNSPAAPSSNPAKSPVYKPQNPTSNN